MATGLRLTDRGVLAVSGDDRVAFLQGLVSNDVAKVSAERAVFAALLTPQGKFLHDFIMVDCGDAILLDVAADRLADLLRRLKPYRLRAKVTLTDVSADWAVGAVIGDGAVLAAGLPGGAGPGTAKVGDDGVTRLVDPRRAELGVRVIGPPAAVDALLVQGGGAAPADYDAARIALGVPDAARDLELEKSTLLEADYDTLNAIAWDKGCYMGQELTARMKYRGLLKRKLVPVRVDGDTPDPGTPVLAGDRAVGEIRSAADGRAIALMRLDALEGGGLTAGASAVHPAIPEPA